MRDYIERHGGLLLVFLFVGIPVIIPMLPFILIALAFFGIVIVGLIIADKFQIKTKS